MGPIPSRPSLSNVLNTLQSALPRRSDRRVEPALGKNSKLCPDTGTSILPAKRRGKRRRFGSWKRNSKRNYCSCDDGEDDDYACVFGRQRPAGSTQSLSPVMPVRRCRPAYPSPLPPDSEYRLFIENIEVEGRTLESTYEEEDIENGRYQRELSTPVIPPGRLRTMYSSVAKAEEPKTEITEPVVQQVNLPEPVLEPEPEPEDVKKELTEEEPPCVCTLPSKKPCPCDKKLFEAMKPWNKVKNVILTLLAVALIGLVVAFSVL